MSDCEELAGDGISGGLAMFGTSHTVKKAVSSKAVGLIYGSKGDMSRSDNTDNEHYGFLELEMYCHDCDTEYLEMHKMAGYKITRKGKNE